MFFLLLLFCFRSTALPTCCYPAVCRQTLTFYVTKMWLFIFIHRWFYIGYNYILNVYVCSVSYVLYVSMTICLHVSVCVRFRCHFVRNAPFSSTFQSDGSHSFLRMSWVMFWSCPYFYANVKMWNCLFISRYACNLDELQITSLPDTQMTITGSHSKTPLYTILLHLGQF